MLSDRITKVVFQPYGGTPSLWTGTRARVKEKLALATTNTQQDKTYTWLPNSFWYV